MKWPVVKLKNEMTYVVHFYSSEKAQTFVNFIQMSKKGGFSTEVAQVIEDKRLTEVGFGSKDKNVFNFFIVEQTEYRYLYRWMYIFFLNGRASEPLLAEIPVA